MLALLIYCSYNKHMENTFDPDKDRTNQNKHQCSLADAEQLDWDTALEWLDDRHEYGEDRYVALAPIGDRIYCVVFVEREGKRRIISLRRANSREVKKWQS